MGKDSPVLSVDVIYKYVLPEVQVGKQVLFIVLDCMGGSLVHNQTTPPTYFEHDNHYYYSIPAHGNVLRANAIFSGLFPLELAQRYPNLWTEIDEENTSINRMKKI